MTKKSSKGTKRVRANTKTYAAFVEAWNSAATRADAVRASGLSEVNAGRWSTKLRKAGVELKKFHKVGVAIDVEALNKIAKRALKA